MRRSALTIGILTAELAVGALAAAPPAGADDTAPAAATASDTPPAADPAPAPIEPTAIIRTGRAVDLPLIPDPVELPRLPLALDSDAGTPSSPPPTVPEPDAPAASSPPVAVPSAPGPTSPVPDPAVPTSTAAVPPASATPAYSVVPGDSLWEIAAAQLARATGRDRGALSTADIAGYWVRVCEANRGRLESGDLNVIYAGEVVELPAI